MKFYIIIILGIIKLGLAVGFLGDLADMTPSMRDEATEAPKAWLISLRKLNQSLGESH